MDCPTCSGNTRVIDSRSTDDSAIRRRRECQECEFRFTTFERLAELEPSVVKRDGRREPFQKEKLLQGIRIAFIKRPVPQSDLDRIAEAVRLRAVHQARQEVSSDEIGEWTLELIHRVDAVAAFRFASVFRRPSDIEALQRELAAVRDTPAGTSAEPSAQPHLPGINHARSAARAATISAAPPSEASSDPNAT
ncbi:MAG TPA: transcriptional regulator NrdR [Dehalococcoidia bacterium]|nr:transcriptional regulator NrdR [Dehalococcoidia bacterium]